MPAEAQSGGLVAPAETLAGVTEEIARIPLDYPLRRRWLVCFAGALALLGLFVGSVGWLFYRGVGVWGNEIPIAWALDIMNYVWWLGIGHAGTLISAMLLLMQQEWRNSLNRFAEAMTLGAVACAGIYPMIHTGRPWLFYWLIPYPSTMGVWPQFRSPLVWDFWAVLTYLTVSVVFWYVGMIPDLASLRDRARRRGWQVFFGVIALGWRGSARHWARWQRVYRLTAAFAVPLVVSVHSEISLLFAAAQLPGWHSTLFPPYFVLGAAFSGFAVVAMITIVLRSTFRLHDLIGERHIDLLAKLLLVTGLATGYGYVFEIFDTFYAGRPLELANLYARMTGPQSWAFWGAVVCNFVPLQLLWLKSVRTNLPLLFAISLSATVGMWFERYMILATGLGHDFLASSWRSYVPSFWDWSTFAGTLGLFLTLFLLFVRYLPMISIAEVKEQVAEREATS